MNYRTRQCERCFCILPECQRFCVSCERKLGVILDFTMSSPVQLLPSEVFKNLEVIF